MQRLEVSGAVRLIYRSLSVKGLISGEICHPIKKVTTHEKPEAASAIWLWELHVKNCAETCEVIKGMAKMNYKCSTLLLLSVIITCSYFLINIYYALNFTSSFSNALDRYRQCNAGMCSERTMPLYRGWLGVLPFEEWLKGTRYYVWSQVTERTLHHTVRLLWTVQGAINV